MGRWIKIYEEIREHWIYQNPLWYRWWTDMLFEASFKDSKVLVRKQLVDLKRGQLSGSISYFVKRWNTTKDQVMGFLKVLQSEGMIDKMSDKNITIITICNYDSYQGRSDNKSDNLFDNLFDNKSDNNPDTNKECIEGKEINNNKSNARTREERVSWDEVKERGFREAFKCGGQIMALARNCKLSASEINEYLERYMNERQVFDMGHQDISHFGRGFKRYIEEEMKKPKPIEQPKSRVIEGKEIFSLYK